MSQFDEDEHIAAVLGEIGEGTRVLADIGARFQGSNSAALIRKGWTGVLVDRNPAATEDLRREFPGMRVLEVAATPQNINDLVPKDAWFLSIDVDSVDWWLWANLVHRPALVVIETNPLPGLYVASIGAKSGYGCSVEAVKRLGEMKGYQYIGRNVVNAFFVANEYPCAYRMQETRHFGSPSSSDNNVMR